MTPEGNSADLDFPRLGPRHVLADFDGGAIASHGGALRLRQTEQLTGILRRFAACFTDHRNPDRIEHPLEHPLAQRVSALALGSEDLNDHDDRRRDPLLATVVGTDDPTGRSRQRRRDRGTALARKSTLNRLELTPTGVGQDSRSKEVTCQTHDIERLLGTLSLQAHNRPPERIIPDLDPPTTRSPATNSGASSTAITRTPVISRGPSFAATTRSAPGGGPPTSTPAPGR